MERSKQQQALSVARFLMNLLIGAKMTRINNQISISNDLFWAMIWATVCSDQKQLLKRSCKQTLCLSSWTANWVIYIPNSCSNDHIMDHLYKFTIGSYQWWIMSSLIASEWLTSSLSICWCWLLHLICTLCQPYAEW